MKKIFVLIITCIAFLGCTTFKPVVTTPADVQNFQPKTDKTYRVVTNTGAAIEAKGSLIKIDPVSVNIAERETIPVSNVSSIDVKKVRKAVIIGSIVGGVLLAALIGGVVAWSKAVSGDDR